MNSNDVFLKLILAALIYALAFAASGAESEQIVTYGDLLVEEVAEDYGNHEILLSGGFDSSNPLLDIYNLSLAYNWLVNSYLQLGLLGRVFDASKTSLLTTVERDFGLLGVDIDAEQPLNSGYLTVSVIPLRGRLNFFGHKTLPYLFSLMVGVGERKTVRDSYLGYMWSMQSRIKVGSNYSLYFSFDQEAEAAFAEKKVVARNQLNLGLAVDF